MPKKIHARTVGWKKNSGKMFSELTVVVNKTFLGHSKKFKKVSPQINRLNRVLMNLNERGEGIFEVFGVFWSVPEKSY